MGKLVELLKEQTQELKVKYIEKTEEWAKSEFIRVSEKVDWTIEKWCDHLGIEGRTVRVRDYSSWEMVDRFQFPENFYNTRNARTYNTQIEAGYKAKRLGQDKFVESRRKDAERHYEASMVKLADRITRKELNQDNLQLKSSHLGVNFETVITDGVKQVTAQTIIASGPVQRPHYRYLVR